MSKDARLLCSSRQKSAEILTCFKLFLLSAEVNKLSKSAMVFVQRFQKYYSGLNRWVNAMISFLLNSVNSKELVSIKECAYYSLSKKTNDQWKCYACSSMTELLGFLSKEPLLDIAYVDVVQKGGIDGVKKLRSVCNEAYVVVIADQTVSPMSYINPEIMAGALLLRPFSQKQLLEVADSILSAYLLKHVDLNAEHKSFVIDNRDGRQLIPYAHINCFEAQSKKINVICRNEEYSYYDTIENLERELPQEFIRCHRSYIVNSSKIVRIIRSQNLIFLDDGEEIPLSRSYKERFDDFRL